MAYDLSSARTATVNSYNSATWKSSVFSANNPPPAPVPQDRKCYACNYTNPPGTKTCRRCAGLMCNPCPACGKMMDTGTQCFACGYAEPKVSGGWNGWTEPTRQPAAGCGPPQAGRQTQWPTGGGGARTRKAAAAAAGEGGAKRQRTRGSRGGSRSGSKSRRDDGDADRRTEERQQPQAAAAAAADDDDVIDLSQGDPDVIDVEEESGFAEFAGDSGGHDDFNLGAQDDEEGGGDIWGGGQEERQAAEAPRPSSGRRRRRAQPERAVPGAGVGYGDRRMRRCRMCRHNNVCTQAIPSPPQLDFQG